MASKWRKVIDPETGKARFTNEPVTASSAPVNASVQVAQTRVGDAVEVPVCACGKAIDGRVVTALQRHWHARCFACTQCNREFEGNVLRYTVINDDEAWCRRCCEYAGKSLDGLTFHALESFDNSEPITLTTRMSDKPVTIDAATGAEPRSLASALTGGDAAPAASGPSCARCSGAVSGHVVEWSGNTYHPGCFLCGYCELPIESATGFNVHEEQPHHKECFKQARAPKCGACQQPCTGKSYNVKGTRYHVGCFKCAHCAAALGGGFFTVEGSMYCKACKQAGTTNPAAAGQAPAPTAAPTAVASASAATAPPTTSTTATPKFCGECGASRPSGARFCGECGSSFSS